MKLDKKLSEIFDIPAEEYSIVPEEKTSDVIETGEIVETSQNKIEDDYNIIRSNLYNLLKTGQDALSDALLVAKDSENPRADEVAGNIMMQLADINNQIMGLHQSKQKLDAPIKAEEAKHITNNSLFVGTSEQLAKMIQDINKGK